MASTKQEQATLLIQCANSRCDQWRPDDYKVGYYIPLWCIDVQTGLCAHCLHDQVTECLLSMTWQFPEGSEEFATVERALDTALLLGVDGFDRHIWALKAQSTDRRQWRQPRRDAMALLLRMVEMMDEQPFVATLQSMISAYRMVQSL